MGKKQHQKDKLYLTTTEWSLFYGGKKPTAESGESSKFRRLPFSCCSLSLQPFEKPYCTVDGHIFELLNILSFLKQYGINPITGEKLLRKDLIKLNFCKNSSDQFHCPVTFKVFNENTHIVAIRTTGNVFCFDAIEKLNIKVNYWKDLLTDEPFTRKDIITIQDPSNLDKFNFSSFLHIKKNLKVLSEEELRASKDPTFHLKNINNETKQVLEELNTTYKVSTTDSTSQVKPKADSVNAAHYSTGRVAASFTSTTIDPVTRLEPAIIDEDTLRYSRIKKKAYIQLVTSHGNINIELHSDQVPKTCENFLKHCLNGYYNGTIFHRSIKNFMIQGGDPDNTGFGGQSIWGGPFKDEFKSNLTHTGRGIVSMANSGPNSNKSQFFLTYRSARHLDNKHSVFGHVVGGMETLDKMEKIKTDDKDRPLEKICIEHCNVFYDPYDEVDKQLAMEREDANVKKLKEDDEMRRKKLDDKTANKQTLKVFSSGVGKYINPKLSKQIQEIDPEEPRRKKFKPVANHMDFSSW
ncbi:hypothetical protein HELRODRAFT_185601 [Helobdella robusta]|uniref:RING-type E3 ubiquitin-protein ligase PPIL2 n=1 Tax=Helobdella robusta TaxID=6412 RepID=T1FN09_HELRO|nr:hypothetical protein HELRODRAFT_185601 [Helobdella robusta]ESO03990.1 hypothetical protein HELRODRAFT_185601 [Helobdella robusta]